MIATRVRWMHLFLALGLVVGLATSVLFPAPVLGVGDSSGSGPRASFQEEEEPEGGDAGDATDPAPADVAPVAEEDGSQEPAAEEDGVQEPAAEEDGAEEPAAEEDGVLEGGEEDAAGTGDPESSTGEGAE
ncbi:MAG: hypothetical protein M3Q71_06415, partial [Chloroflexota bacterium]|nr:hypothetical protein [Chloroflexota bacterium]